MVRFHSYFQSLTEIIKKSRKVFFLKNIILQNCVQDEGYLIDTGVSSMYVLLHLFIFIIQFSTFSLYSQEKEISKFEVHKEQAAKFEKAKDIKNVELELLNMSKAAVSREEKTYVNVRLGKLYFEKGDYGASKERFSEAERLNSESPLCYYLLARIYSIENDSEKAVHYLDKAMFYKIYKYFDFDQIRNEAELDFKRFPNNEYYKRFLENTEKIKSGFRLYEEGKADEGNIKKLEKSKKFIEEGLGESSLVVAGILNEIGLKYLDMSEFDKSEISFNDAISIFTSNKLEFRNLFLSVIFSNLGWQYQSRGNYDKALESYRKAEEIYLAVVGRETLEIAAMNVNIGLVYSERGDFEKAIDKQDNALRIYRKFSKENSEEFAIALNNKALALDGLEKYEEALEHYKKTEVIFADLEKKTYKNQLRYAQKLNSLSEKKGKTQDKSSSQSLEDEIRNLEELEIKSKLQVLRYKRNIAGLYNNIGELYKKQGEVHKIFNENENMSEKFRLSEEYHKKAYSIYRKTVKEDDPLIAKSLNNIGEIYVAQEKYKDAMKEYSKSRDIRKNLYKDERHPDLGVSYLNLGELHKKERNYKDALENLQKALNIFIKSEDRKNQILCYASLRDVYRKQGRKLPEVQILSQAADLVLSSRKEMGKEKEKFTKRFLYIFEDLRDLYIEQEEFEKALDINEKMRGLSISEDVLLKYALTNSGVSEEKKLKLLTLKAGLESLHSERAAVIRKREENSEKTAQAIKDKIEMDEKEFQNLNKVIMADYPLYSQFQKMSSPTIFSIQKRLKKSGKIFLEFFFSGYSGEEELRVFIIGSNFFESLSLGKNEGTRKIKNEIAILRKILSVPPKNRGLFKSIKNGNEIIPFMFTSAKYIDYAVGSRICTADTEPEQCQSSDVPKAKVIGIYDHDMSMEETESLWKNSASDLYNVLIKPVIEKVKENQPENAKKENFEFVISPDGDLYNLPFSALINERGEYLAEKISISLIQSASVWLNLRSEGQRKYAYPIFAVGNPVYAANHSIKPDTRDVNSYRSAGLRNSEDISKINLNNLPGSKKELLFLSEKYYKPEVAENHILQGVNANTEEIFEKFSYENKSSKEANYRIIHFSVHGLFFSDTPELNSLALTSRKKAEEYSKDMLEKYDASKRKKAEELGQEELRKYEERKKKDSEREGFLKMGDIAELNFKTDLVVLSACETSLGTHLAGEGMVGLPQAFLMSGAKNVLATLWPVDDNGTMLFFKDYYSIIDDSRLTPLETLQQTQKKRRTNEKDIYNDPFYWSPFVIYGE